jgi:hypothetical protein
MCLHRHHYHHTSQGFGPHQEVSKMGAKTSHQGAEAWEGEDQPGVFPNPSCSPDLSSAVCFLFLKGKRTASQHHPGPGHLQMQLGTGYQDHRHWRVRRRLSPMVRAQQKVSLHQWLLCGEIIRRKCFSISYPSRFIHIVSFGFEPTSYVLP